MGIGLCLFLPQQNPKVLGSERAKITNKLDDTVFETGSRRNIAVFDARQPETEQITVVYLDGNLNKADIAVKNGWMHGLGLILIVLSASTLLVDTICDDERGLKE